MIVKRLKNRLVNFLYFGNRFRNPFYKEFKFLFDYIPKGAVILEAGAHSGSDTIRMSHAFPGSIIHSFEPEPTAYKKLIKKTYGYKNIHVYNIALGERDEMRKLYVSKDLLDASSSLLPQTQTSKKIHPGIKLDQSLDVSVRTIDSWAKENAVDHIDFMWLDMQGNELRALKSAKSLLHTVKAIYTEVLKTETYEGAPLYPEFKQWMEQEGFIAKIEREVYDEQTNILFIKK